VLDAGCGAGDPITRILGRSFRVMGVDFAEEQLLRARRVVPTGHFVCADLRTVEFRDASFDAMCSYYAIIHIPRDEHAQLFVKLARFLKPGGVALLCLGAQELPFDRSDDYLGAPMVWSHFDAATNLQLVAATGLCVEWTERVADAGSPDASHIFVLASKPRTAVC
jgi:ubiquinone/menaquinone biosynthesis C-methylase UbiE